MHSRLIGSRRLMIEIPGAQSCYLLPNQSEKDYTPCSSCTPSFANKSFFLETHQEVYLFWALADQTLFLAPYNASCTVFHHNLVSVGWHMSKWTQVWFSDNLFSLKQLLWIRTFLRSEACCKASAYGICETGHKWKKVILYFITRTIFTPWEFLMSFACDFFMFPNMLRQLAWWNGRMAFWRFSWVTAKR